MAKSEKGLAPENDRFYGNAMPYKSAKPCRFPGCPNLIRGDAGYCPVHKRRMDAEYDAQRGTAAQRGYGHRWRKIRNAYLASNPFCECTDPDCYHTGHQVLATDVDHRLAKKNGGTDEWDNLQALCHRCHSRKTAVADGRWGRKDSG